MRLTFLVVPTVLVSCCAAAHADTIYTYTGQDFAAVLVPFTTGDSVTGSFTTASSLGDNLDNAMISPSSFSFSDGVSTITNTNDSDTLFEVSTNSSGDIVDWDIIVEADGSAEQIGITGGPEWSGDGDLGASNGGYGLNFVSGSFSPGVATSVTPEPSSFVLLGMGLLGVCGALRRRLV